MRALAAPLWVFLYFLTHKPFIANAPRVFSKARSKSTYTPQLLASSSSTTSLTPNSRSLSGLASPKLRATPFFQQSHHIVLTTAQGFLLFDTRYSKYFGRCIFLYLLPYFRNHGALQPVGTPYSNHPTPDIHRALVTLSLPSALNTCTPGFELLYSPCTLFSPCITESTLTTYDRRTVSTANFFWPGR